MINDALEGFLGAVQFFERLTEDEVGAVTGGDGEVLDLEKLAILVQIRQILSSEDCDAGEMSEADQGLLFGHLCDIALQMMR